MKKSRVPFLLPAAVALVAGLAGALHLLGLWPGDMLERLGAHHGVVMVLGFVGTLIALERAVAARTAWAFAAPAATGAGALVLVLTDARVVGGALLAVGMLVLTCVYSRLWARVPAPEIAAQALGAVLGAGAALMWAGGADVPRILPWLAGFVVLTIAGERADLARLSHARMGMWVLIASAVVAGAAVTAVLWPALGSVLFGVSILALTGVLVATDMARRTVRTAGLPRFAALAMLAGYGWLAVAGSVWLTGAPDSGGAYDAVIHTVFVGFTMSMIFAHAPIILPAVLGVNLPYVPLMYLPLGLLHFSLVLRVVLGDFAGVDAAHQMGSVLGVIALVLFVAIAVGSAVRATVHSHRDQAPTQGRQQSAPVAQVAS
ncbi:hypothetical protein [Demequina sp.]|uniref:hypothetical protein n=1 Tax=Demequina sp. TaxID=2050685 RepID=UPI003A855037